MNYNQLLKQFTIFINTIPNKIDFYDIWEIRDIFEELHNNYNYLNFKQKKEYLKLVQKLNTILNKVTIEKNDPLVEEEVIFLKSMIKKEKNHLQVA